MLFKLFFYNTSLQPYKQTILTECSIVLFNKCSIRMSLSFHHEDGAPNGGWILSECCNQKGFGHLQVVCQRRSDAVDLEGCLPCPGFLFSHSQ